MYQFKAKDSKTKPHSLCLRNISEDFTVDNMKQNRLNALSDFSVDYNTIDIGNIVDIHKFLMKKHDIV